jgi:hypothetical protein
MAIKIKQKAAAVFEEVQLPASLTKPKTSLSKADKEAVDRLVTLELQLAETKPLEKERDNLKKVRSAKADELFEPEEQAVLKGFTGVVQYSPCNEKRCIEDMDGVLKLLREKLGYEGLISLLKISLADVDKYLSEAEAKPFLSKKPGSRSLNSVHFKGE